MFKKETQRALLYIALSLQLTACQPSDPHPPTLATQPQTPIAKVGSHTINQEDLDAEIRELPEQLQQQFHTAENQQQILQTLIRREVLSQHASDLGLDNDPAIHYRIQRSRDSIMIEALRTWQLNHTPAPSDESIQRYYQKHLADFSTPEQIHARHILLRDKKQAMVIYQQLTLKKERFTDLAARYSLDDSNKSRGGDLNWFPRGIMVPSFEKAAFSLQNAGDISQPIQTQYGWHVIELLDKRAASQASLHEVHDDIAQILRQQSLDQWVTDLVKKSQPHILKPNNNPITLHY